ncbi:MCE family protein [Fodinicola feengrottensis]|uniref:MCE family protein n=1 Tax=Fodinicola feengrottensis TaxID=435914 RepID=UPI0024413D16|nr:MCE family protein [Fodinicola feengrottensis]
MVQNRTPPGRGGVPAGVRVAGQPLGGGFYQKAFSSALSVTLLAGTAGNQMHRDADVKVRGVVVGQVRQISSDGSQARLRLAIDPQYVPMLPANVTAQLLPTSLFGDRYVALLIPATPSPEKLSDGATIDLDRSAAAIQLDKVLGDMLPLLTAVQPEKLAETLTAISQALQGRGPQLGRTLVQLDDYLTKFNPQLPDLTNDIHELVTVADAYASAAPDIVDALNDFSVTTQTILDQRTNLETLYQSVTSTSADLETFLSRNKNTIIRLSANSRVALQILAKYSPEYPCVLAEMAAFVPVMDKVLGKGTNQPGLHVKIDSVPSRGRYLPGKDTPTYSGGGQPHCYPTDRPFTATGVGSPQTPPTVSTTNGGLGLPNSATENQFVNELVAPQVGQSPSQLPDWSSVLVGPIYRGAEVTLQ